MKKPKQSSNNKAFVLCIALVTLTVLLAAGVGLLQIGSSARLQTARTAAEISARAAADAGVEQAIFMMNNKLNAEDVWDNTSLPAASTTNLPNCYADYSFNVAGDASSGFLISATGTSAMASKTVSGRLAVKSLWFGLAVSENINIANQVELATTPGGGDLTISTNDTRPGAVQLGNNCVVDGDIIIGPRGAIDEVIQSGTDVLVTGSKRTAEKALEFPPVTVPEDLRSMAAGSYVYQAGVALSGNLRFSSLSIPAGAFQVISGDCRIYVSGQVDFAANCWLVIPPDASLNLYIDGRMEDYSASIANQSGNPSRFRILGTNSCNSIWLGSGSHIHAAIYAPQANVVIDSGGNFYGACVCEKISVQPSGNFYYPTSLAQNIGINDESAYFATDYWWE